MVSSGIAVEEVAAKLGTVAPLSILAGGSTALVSSGIAAKLGTLAPGSDTASETEEDRASGKDAPEVLPETAMDAELRSMAVELRSWRVGCGLLTEADAKAEERELAVRSAHWAGATEAQRLAEVDRLMLRYASLSVAADEHALPAVVAEEDALAPRCRAKGRRRR